MRADLLLATFLALPAASAEVPARSTPIWAACRSTNRARMPSSAGCFLTRNTFSGGSVLYFVGASGRQRIRVVRAQPVYVTTGTPPTPSAGSTPDT